jgi:UDP-glucose 4-epimerase
MDTPRVVITGVAGFIGSALDKILCNNGVEVIGIDNFLCGYKLNLAWVDTSIHKFTLHTVSVSDKEVSSIIKKNDIIVHLAAITALPSNQVNTNFSYKNNVVETLSILEVARLKGVSHLIFASSCCVYENSIYTEPIKEDVVTHPSLIYSVGKKHCEELIESYYHNYGLPYTIFRLFNVYGPGADESRLQPGIIPYIISQLKKGGPITLHGDGEQKRDYIFLWDLIELLVCAIEKGAVNTRINAASGKTISVNEIFSIVSESINIYTKPTYKDVDSLWDKFEDLFKGELPFKKSSVAHDVVKYTLGDTTKASDIYKWKAKTSFKEGIKRVVNTV